MLGQEAEFFKARVTRVQEGYWKKLVAGTAVSDIITEIANNAGSIWAK
jgi:hypothetical protein